jgi:hypothetical protein
MVKVAIVVLVLAYSSQDYRIVTATSSRLVVRPTGRSPWYRAVDAPRSALSSGAGPVTGRR